MPHEQLGHLSRIDASEPAWSRPCPQAKSTMEFAWVCKSQPIGDFTDGHLRVAHVVFGEVTAHAAQQPGVCRSTARLDSFPK